MKLSLGWIFEHIVGDVQKIDVPHLIDIFNRKTAAIEHYTPFELAINQMTLVCVKEVNDGFVVAFSPEWQKKIELPSRLNAVIGAWFLIRTMENGGFAWMTLADGGASSKEGLMPAVFCSSRKYQAGGWKKNIEVHDYILDLDNPSITHRPDLWGVRGIARECAALLGLKLRPLTSFLQPIEVKAIEQDRYEDSETQSFSIINGAPQACKRFAGLSITNIQAQGCILPIALRLCRTDHRPVNALVDATNYAMLDLGQPMHAFDAKKVGTYCIKPRMAVSGEQITLLDGAQITLSEHDLVISDGKRPISLVGIMGGIDTAVDRETSSIFIESASFDSSVIRRSSARYHIRTEASARFEKGLDPNQGADAIKRLLKLLVQFKIPHSVVTPLVVLGKPFVPYHIEISHTLIEARLGMAVDTKKILTLLRAIGFTVSKERFVYHIDVPTFRGTKSVTIAEDIIDEVGRLIGWDTIPYAMPRWVMAPHDMRQIMRLRMIKQQLAFALKLHEVNNYPFFDERFLQELNWQPEHSIRAKNPLSLNVTRLITSLVPHLLMNVQQNIHSHDQLRFFECNRIWPVETETSVIEHKSCAGILWHAKGLLDFYEGKCELSSLFDLLSISVKWLKPEKQPAAWYSVAQTAQLMVKDNIIGYAGMIDSAFVHDKIVGSGFVFELDLDKLSLLTAPMKLFKPLSKYPYVYLDISLLISLEQTVDAIERLIRTVDKRIYNVELVDMFFKDEWQDCRSLTFRYYMRDPERTLVKKDIDVVSARVIAAIKELGAEVR